MTNPSIVGGLQAAARTRASDTAHLDSMVGKIIKTWGLIDTDGSGELLFDVTFPIVFLELPAMSFGFSLLEGETITTGVFPTCSVGVHSFVYSARRSGPRYYSGAKLIIVTTGLSDQQMTIHYQFEGRAIVPPVTTEQLAEDIV